MPGRRGGRTRLHPARERSAALGAFKVHGPDWVGSDRRLQDFAGMAANRTMKAVTMRAKFLLTNDALNKRRTVPKYPVEPNHPASLPVVGR